MSIMTAMPQGAAVEGINPNLLDNWYFVGSGQFPINQRGATSYSANGYSIDRWKVYSASGGTLTFNNAYLTLRSTGNSTFCIFQLVDILSDELAGRAATVSVLTNTRLLTQTLTNITVPSNRTRMLELNDDTTRIEWYLSTGAHPEFFIEAKAGATTNIIAAKLELGDQQTLAHQENGVWVLNEIPNYQQELAKCQRYFWNARFPSTAAGQYVAPISNFSASVGTSASCQITLPVPMRSAPTVSGTLQYLRGTEMGNPINLNSGFTLGTTANLQGNTANFTVTHTSHTFPGLSTGLYGLFSALTLSAEL